MASLKQIMNVDEDSPDSESHIRAQYSASTSSRVSLSTSSAQALASTSTSTPTSTSAPASASTLASSYTPPFTHAFPHSTSSAYTFNPQLAAASSRNPHPFAPEVSNSPSPYSPSAEPTSGRRVSSTSTESMDSYHHQGAGYGQDYDDYSNPSSGGPSRSQGAGSSGNDGSQRMTPITNRPSKAMKGRPVHICELCRPPKAFTRAEHLRRHRPSHFPPQLACTVPGCDRFFWRQDLLDRHHMKHKQDGNIHGDSGPSHHSQGGSGDSPNAGLGGRETPYSRAPGSQSAGSHAGQPESMPPGSWQHMMPGSSPGHDHSQASPSWPPYNTTEVDWSTYPVHGIPRTSPEMPIALSHPYSNMGASSQQGAMHYNPLGDMPFPGYDENPVLAPHNPPHSTVRSLPLTLAEGPSSEFLVTYPSAAPSGPVGSFVSRGRSGGWRPEPTAVAALMMPVSLSEEARVNVPSYVNVYWDKVHPRYPIIHRSTFDDEERNGMPDSEPSVQRALRRYAMAAIATQFLEDKTHRVHGDELHSHAWYMAIEQKNTEVWTLETMQTILLCEFYARFRGKKKTSHLPSSQFRLLFQNAASYKDIFAPVSPRGNNVQTWKEWIYVESRRRILAACFLLDVHALCYFRQPAVSAQGLDYSSVSRLPIPLSAGMEELWNATSCRTWHSLAQSGPELKLLSSMQVSSLTADDVTKASPFDAAIMLAGCILQLRATHVGRSLHPSVDHLASLFRGSGTAFAYLAFHHTPLHEVLSVSGDSWLFNEKILQPNIFMNHRQTLANWSTSNGATTAAFFAVRGIASFINLRQETLDDMLEVLSAGRPMTWPDISDFWGLYVCTLICWAWGQGSTASQDSHQSDVSKRTATAWLLTAVELTPHDLREWAGRRKTRAVVCLIRDMLERGCPGGRNRLFGDAVDVLKKLSDRTTAGGF